MDEGDQANAENAVHWKAAMKKIRQQFGAGPSQAVCIDCGLPIPQARRRAMAANGMACERCVSCQTDFERGHGGGA